MYRAHLLPLLLATSTAFLASLPASAQMAEKLTTKELVPSLEKSLKLESLGPNAPAQLRPLPNVQNQKTVAPNLRELKVNQEQLSPMGKQRFQNNAAQPTTEPFVSSNSMVILFTPQTTAEEIEDYLQTNNFEVIQTFKSTGAVQVKTDLSRYFRPQLTDRSPNEALIRGLTSAITDFQRDPRVLSATPDVVLTDKQENETPSITNFFKPNQIFSSTTAEHAAQVKDWGIEDIQAEQLWDLPGADDGVLFGVLDVGFSRHEDLTFIGFPRQAANDHGNHVAGIGCGKHDSKGVQGVLPNCFIRARASDIIFESPEGTPELSFLVLFSQVLSSLDRFVGEEENVPTFNVSLGYNWRSNFGINPDLPESAQWRTLVESQGSILVPLLQAADRRGIVIFSAAGNDSGGLDTPIEAKYASPFNWAALKARELGLANNGIIVGAHGPDGKRAKFSNAGADISCPGVDILSSVSFDENGEPSAHSYGKMSGTSMASPYCASSHILLSLVRPGYTGRELVSCMEASAARTDENVPMLRLGEAIVSCPERQ